MLIKTLQVTEALFMEAPRIKTLLGAGWNDFFPHLERLRAALRQGPNPSFNDPLIDALALGFRGPAERVIDGILTAHGFDYRFITGRRRSFKKLRDPATVPGDIQRLWQRVAGKSDEMMAQISSSSES